MGREPSDSSSNQSVVGTSDIIPIVYRDIDSIGIIYESPTQSWRCLDDQKARRLWVRDCYSSNSSSFFSFLVLRLHTVSITVTKGIVCGGGNF